MALTGHYLMTHQRHIVDVALELNDDGRLVYGVVVLVMPRQNGKTTLVESLLTWGQHRRPDSTAVYAAQNRLMARGRLLDEYEAKRLARAYATKGLYTCRRSNGSEGIYWRNGSKLVIVANTDDAGHGLTTDQAVVDEAFSQRDLRMVAALSPTMITRPDPQLWIISTPGDGTDGLLMHYQDVGLASLYDEQTNVAYFEWSRADDESPQDPEVWRRRIPAIGQTINEDRLRLELASLGEPEFDRAYLCHRREETVIQKIPPDVWARQHRPEAVPTAPHVLAFDVAHDRQSATIATCSRTQTPGEVVVIVEHRPGTSWLIPELVRLQARYRPAAIVGDRRAPAGSLIDRLTAKGVPVLEPDTVEFTQSGGVLYDGLVDDGNIVHTGQADLDKAVAQAHTRPLGDSWAWNRRDSPVDISPICAVTMAAWGHRKLFPTATQGRIY
jgi:hypothetical protein